MVGIKTKIKKGDKVLLRKGKDAGKSGKVLRVIPDKYTVVVEGLNILKKNIRAKKQGEKGQIVSVPSPVRVENVSLVCPGCHKPTRIGTRMKGDKKERYCKKCKAKI
ncbi:MAG: 50S ribosomal protein L24 [bacterium]|nr:50S ribosomal protein L24 [bacterium]MDZ4231360.1 50S ribosomal protein L24 [Patescibacteria group bacterium]